MKINGLKKEGGGEEGREGGRERGREGGRKGGGASELGKGREPRETVRRIYSGPRKTCLRRKIHVALIKWGTGFGVRMQQETPNRGVKVS